MQTLLQFQYFPILKNQKSIIGPHVTTNLQKSFALINNTNCFLTPSHHDILPSIRSSNRNKPRILEILFHGLNLSAKRRKLRRLTYQVDVHKSELFICPQNYKTEYKSRIYRRRLILVSNYPNILDSIGRFIKKFKSPDTYTGKGLFFRTDNYKVKKGKEYKR